jgi:hypothetical protein
MGAQTRPHINREGRASALVWQDKVNKSRGNTL